jgi:Rrf2 family protein
MLSNTHFSLAVHVLSALAFNEGQVVGSGDLAKSMGTNPSFLRGIIGQLRVGGLVETRLGKGGGSTLARPADQITLLDIYNVTEQKPALTAHVCDGSSPCPVARNMEKMLEDLNRKLEDTVTTELQKTTLADLVGNYIR